MPLRPDLISAYEKAHYAVLAEPELVIRIGEPNPDLDALLAADGAATAAYITAANPHGASQDESQNKLAMIALGQALGDDYACYPGEGRDPEGTWSAEPSLLVVGISRADAEALGRKYEQNAIVFIDKGRAPELVLLA